MFSEMLEVTFFNHSLPQPSQQKLVFYLDTCVIGSFSKSVCNQQAEISQKITPFILKPNKSLGTLEELSSSPASLQFAFILILTSQLHRTRFLLSSEVLLPFV